MSEHVQRLRERQSHRKISKSVETDSGFVIELQLRHDESRGQRRLDAGELILQSDAICEFIMSRKLRSHTTAFSRAMSQPHPVIGPVLLYANIM
jgi:hypothetical protein